MGPEVGLKRRVEELSPEMGAIYISYWEPYKEIAELERILGQLILKVQKEESVSIITVKAGGQS